MSAVLRQIQQSEQTQEWLSLESPFIGKIDILIQKIKHRSWIYLNAKTPESLGWITQVLDEIKALLDPLSKVSIRDLLQSMQERDRTIWDQFIWQNIDWKNQAYHERNDSNGDIVLGINPEQLLQIAERDPANRVRTLVLRLTEIYGFNPKLLSRLL